MKGNRNEKAVCKVIPKPKETDRELQNLLRHEASIHKKCQGHENIVKLFAAFDDEKCTFLIMELCNGTLSDLIYEEGFVEFDNWIRIMRQIVSGLAFIHEQDIIHRDLKPCNILLNEHHSVKICDFGLSIEANQPLVKLKQFCGTIAYMAPEVINHMGAKTSSDIWATAVIGYFLYKGERPFDKVNEIERYVIRVYKRIQRGEFALKPDRDDPDFQKFINLCFNNDWRDRPSAIELLHLPMFNRRVIPRAKVPRRGHEVTIVPTHVLSADKIYVQVLGEFSADFDEMQFDKLQKIELKVLTNPGENIIFSIKSAKLAPYILNIIL